jgi:hypothetical protein
MNNKTNRVIGFFNLMRFSFSINNSCKGNNNTIATNISIHIYMYSLFQETGRSEGDTVRKMVFPVRSEGDTVRKMVFPVRSEGNTVRKMLFPVRSEGMSDKVLLFKNIKINNSFIFIKIVAISYQAIDFLFLIIIIKMLIIPSLL